VWQLMLCRGVISTTVMGLLLFGRVKATIYDSVQSDQINGLIFRLAQGVTSIVLVFFILKFFSPTIYTTTANLQPLLVVFLAACYLKEKLTRFDII
jgi:drug/metabolite transporter (DMT)-like permease